MFESSVIRKDTGSSLYFREPRQAEQTTEQQFAAILARMSEAVDITIQNSLLDRFLGVEGLASTLQTQLNQVLNGELQFTSIALPDSFTLPESRIVFGGAGAHNHQGGPYGVRISHLDLANMTEDDHHPRVHALIGPDHYGSIMEEMISWAGPTGHRHDGLTASAVWHQWLSGITPDDHHATIHDIQSHTGNLQALQVLMGTSNVEETIQLLQLVVTAHENKDVFEAHNLTLAQLLNLGIASDADLLDHTTDPTGHSDVADQGAAISLMQGDISSIAAALIPIGTDISLLSGRIFSLETIMPDKMNTSEFAWRLENYGGVGSILGGASPIEVGVFANLVVTQAQIESIIGLLSLSVEDLAVTGTVSIPDASLQLAAILSDGTPVETWTQPRPLLKDDLDRMRYVISRVTGENFDYASATAPTFSETSSFAGDTIKTFEEFEWYRNWLMSHDYCMAMVCDTFEDDAFADHYTGTISGHMFTGPGEYVTKLETYGGAIQDLTFFVVHVESNAPAQVTVEVTVNNGTDWFTVDNTAFDLAQTIPVAKAGKEVQVKVTISGDAKVYSFGVLFGWRF